MADASINDQQEEELTALEAEAESLDDDHDLALEAIAAAILLLTRRYYRGVRGAITEAGRDGKFTVQEARQIVAQLPELLDEAGLANVLDKFADEAEALSVAAAGTYEAVGLTAAGGADAEIFLDLVHAGQKELAEEITKRLVGQVEVALLGAGLVGFDRTQLLDRIRQLEGAMSDKQILAAVDDSLARLNRVVVLQKGKDLGLQVYLFVGPRDQRNCVICRKILDDAPHGVPGAYYLDEITDLGLAPEIGGGHPRCRHIWLGLPDAKLEELGFKPRGEK